MKYINATLEEIILWRERVKTGKYPKDYERILSNADNFIKDPLRELYLAEPVSPVKAGMRYEPQMEGVGCKDAAFMYLITGDDKYYNAVSKLLLAQSSEPLTKFWDRSRWQPNLIRDLNPGFFIAAWLSRLLFAYDSISSHNGFIDDFFKDAAKFFYDLTILQYSRVWRDRDLAKVNSPSWGNITDHLGYKIPNLAKAYNNRMATIIKFIAFSGIKFGIDEYKLEAKRWVKEWLKYSVFSNGDTGEMERSTIANPSSALYYETMIIGEVADIADMFYRAGDNELYEYSTSEGMFTTEGGNKTILLTIKRVLDHLNGKVNHSVTSKTPTTYIVNQQVFAKANLYYKDKYIEDSFRIDYQKPYATMGVHQPFSGVWEVYPAMLLQYDREPEKEFSKVWQTKAELKDGEIAISIV